MTNSLMVSTSDFEQFVLSQEVTSKSVVLSFLMLEPAPNTAPNTAQNTAPNIELNTGDSVIELPTISTATLLKIINFYEHDKGLHHVDDYCDCHMTEWHMETIFVDADAINDLIKAADYLDMPCLTKLAQIALYKRSSNGSHIVEEAPTSGCKPKVTRRFCSSGKENQPGTKRPRIL